MNKAENEARDAIGAALPADVFQTLVTFVGSLETWGAVTNLVSAADRDRLWSRHVADSLQLVGHAKDRGPRWIDLGSGAGFPGLVVAIARGDTAMTLVESNKKKAAFLLRAGAACGVALNVKPVRAEALPATAHDVVSARALAPLHKLLGLTAPFFGSTTLGLFPKGRDAATEIDEARRHFRFDVEAHPSRTDPDGAILAVTNLERV